MVDVECVLIGGLDFLEGAVHFVYHSHVVVYVGDAGSHLEEGEFES